VTSAATFYTVQKLNFIPNMSNLVIFLTLLLAYECHGCFSLHPIFGGRQSGVPPLARRSGADLEISRINSPGQRFTATHGISLAPGETKMFVFDVDRADVNYLAVSANVAMEGSNGDPQKYEIFMKYEGLPSVSDHDLKSSLTASDSYVGNVLFSRDITVTNPKPGRYFLRLVAYEHLRELLMTAIMDTPPDERQASFTIRRMGQAV